MNIDWVSPELKSIIQMALIAHEMDHLKDFWRCRTRECTDLRKGIVKSIEMEAKIMAVEKATVVQ